MASGGGGGGVSSYNDLEDRPRIGGVLLAGDKTAQDLGLQPKGDYAKKTDIPTTLPSPYTLTFAGAVEAAYDGSKAVTVTIPTIAGPPGVSPTVSTEEIDGGTRVVFTFKGGSETVDILNGKTPVKGIDYGTEQDIQEIAKQAAELVPRDRTLYQQSLPIAYDSNRVVYRPVFKRELAAGDKFFLEFLVTGVTSQFSIRPGVALSSTQALFPNASSTTVSAKEGTQRIVLECFLPSNLRCNFTQNKITSNQVSSIDNHVMLYELSKNIYGLYCDIGAGGVCDSITCNIFSTVELEV